MIYGNCVKRVLDFSAALIVLAVLLVPFLALAALLAAANRGTPFFRQTRPGRHGKLFRWELFYAAIPWMNCPSCSMCWRGR